MHLYPIDGAAHDVGPTDTAWATATPNWGSVFAGVDPDPANVDAIRRWCVDYFEALHPYSAGGAYVNMMMDEGQERVRASYRDNYDRLAADQGDLRPGQPLPGQPEHPAAGLAPHRIRSRGGRSPGRPPRLRSRTMTTNATTSRPGPRSPDGRVSPRS